MPSFFLMIRRPPRSTLFPYPPLFRSCPASSGPRGDSSRRGPRWRRGPASTGSPDRKSTRLNSSHSTISDAVFFFNDTATTEIYTLSLPAALPILSCGERAPGGLVAKGAALEEGPGLYRLPRSEEHTSELQSLYHLRCRLFF